MIGNISKARTSIEDLKKTILENLTGSLIKKIILFGSVAKGLENEGSDIDLFVLVKNLEVKKEVETFIEGLSIKCFDLYGNRLAPYVLTEHEMKQRENLSVIKEINQGIEIFPASRGSDVTENMAEYEERLVYGSEAEKVLKDCERFLEFVKKSLP